MTTIVHRDVRCPSSSGDSPTKQNLNRTLIPYLRIQHQKKALDLGNPRRDSLVPVYKGHFSDDMV